MSVRIGNAILDQGDGRDVADVGSRAHVANRAVERRFPSGHLPARIVGIAHRASLEAACSGRRSGRSRGRDRAGLGVPVLAPAVTERGAACCMGHQCQSSTRRPGAFRPSGGCRRPKQV